MHNLPFHNEYGHLKISNKILYNTYKYDYMLLLLLPVYSMNSIQARLGFCWFFFLLRES